MLKVIFSITPTSNDGDTVYKVREMKAAPAAPQSVRLDGVVYNVRGVVLEPDDDNYDALAVCEHMHYQPNPIDPTRLPDV